jgi:hypothetical protein
MYQGGNSKHTKYSIRSGRCEWNMEHNKKRINETAGKIT